MVYGECMKNLKDTLERYIKAKDGSVLAFSRAVACDNAWVGRVLQGRRAPDGDAAKKWADHFCLTGDERSEFITLATAAKAARQTRAAPKIAELEQEIVTIQQGRDALARDIDQLRSKLERLTEEHVGLLAQSRDLVAINDQLRAQLARRQGEDSPTFLPSPASI